MISRRYRNRRIGDFLKELKLVEGRNTGIPTILRAMERNGSEQPIFETDDDRTYLTVILPVQKSFISADVIVVPHKKRRFTLGELKEKIIEILSAHGDMSSTELSQALGYSRPTPLVAQAIKELIKSGAISYLVPDKPTSKYQKLMITKQ